jgi:hypothetical protein
MALAEVYRRGSKRVARSIEESLKWHTLAAESGNWHYQESLGLRYLWYEEERRDVRLAFLWLRRAAENGSVEAAYLLGGEYAVGENVSGDPKEAAKWYELAAYAASPEPAAQYSLGQMYLDGEGVAKDVQKGKELLVRAANNGDIVSALFLADAYLEPYPEFEKDAEKSEFWRCVSGNLKVK